MWTVDSLPLSPSPVLMSGPFFRDSLQPMNDAVVERHSRLTQLEIFTFPDLPLGELRSLLQVPPSSTSPSPNPASFIPPLGFSKHSYGLIKALCEDIYHSIFMNFSIPSYLPFFLLIRQIHKGFKAAAVCHIGKLSSQPYIFSFLTTMFTLITYNFIQMKKKDINCI